MNRPVDGLMDSVLETSTCPVTIGCSWSVLDRPLWNWKVPALVGFFSDSLRLFVFCRFDASGCDGCLSCRVKVQVVLMKYVCSSMYCILLVNSTKYVIWNAALLLCLLVEQHLKEHSAIYCLGVYMLCLLIKAIWLQIIDFVNYNFSIQPIVDN